MLIGLAFSIAFVTGPANTFLFLYTERVLDLGPGTTAALVLAAGPAGLLGLLAGRMAADRFGRRPAGRPPRWAQPSPARSPTAAR